MTKSKRTVDTSTAPSKRSPLPVQPGVARAAEQFAQGPISNLHIRLPEDLHYRLKVRALEARMSLQDYVVGILQNATPATPSK